METTARAAGAADLAEVVALCEVAIEELRPHRGGSIWSRLEARDQPVAGQLQSAIESDRSLVAVGLIDETVVGYAAADIRDLHDGARIGDLTDFFVLPDARGVGVGEAMMELAIDWCHANNCIGIDSIALPGDRATKNFFETFGLVARAIRVHREL